MLCLRTPESHHAWPPSTLHPAGEGLWGGRAPRNGHRRDTACIGTSRCPGNGSRPWNPRHPRGQLSNVGGSFHGGSPEGVQPRLWKGAGGLCPGTVGFCSGPAVSEDQTRALGGGQTWARVPPSLGVLNQPWGKGRKGAQGPLPDPASTWRAFPPQVPARICPLLPRRRARRPTIGSCCW